MKKSLKYIITHKKFEDKASEDADKIEKIAERELPQKVNKEIERHYLLYILGALLVLILVGYFAIIYAKDTKETKKNQDLLQQQIILQKEQLDLQAKQIEGATKTTAPASINTPKTSGTIKPTTSSCNTTMQQDQITRINARNSMNEINIKNMESEVRQWESELIKPEPYSGYYDHLRYNITDYNSRIVYANDDINRCTEQLASIKSCKLLNDQSQCLFSDKYPFKK